MNKTFAIGLALSAFALCMSASASAQMMLDPPGDAGFYECNQSNTGMVMRYAVDIPPNQVVYVYQCQGESWILIDIEYY